MSLNLDEIIRAGDVEIQHRIRRYDVDWGRPHFAVTYKRLMFAKMPTHYWSMEDSTYGGGTKYSRNWGSAGRDHDLVYYGYANMAWELGQADPTDNKVDFQNNGYAEESVTVSNSGLSLGYSIVLWIKPNSVLADGTVDGLLSKQTTYGGSNGLCSIHLEGHNGMNRLAVWLNNNQVFYTAPEDVVFEAGKWYCIILTVAPGGPLTDTTKPLSVDNPRAWADANPMVLYVNGVDVYNSSTTPNRPDLVTNDCKWLVGATRQSGTPTWYFDGSIDEVGVFPTAFNEFTAQQIYAVGLSATYLEPDEDFDNDVVGSYADQKRYQNLIVSHSPTHYWPLDEIKDGALPYYKYVDDLTPFGLYSTPLSIAQNAGDWSSTRIVDTPLNTSNYTPADVPGKALRFSGDSYPGIAYGADPGNNLIWDRLSTEVNEVTFETWFKKGNAANVYWDGIIGLADRSPSVGFQMGVKGDGDRPWKIRVDFRFSLNGTQTKSVEYDGRFSPDSWYHIACTLDKNGEFRLFVNGVLRASESWGRTYAYQSPRFANFYVGGKGNADPFQTSPYGYFDDIATYARALSAAEIYSHYWTGVNGPYAKVTLNGGDPLQDPSPFIIGTNEYSELINEEDITEYVEAYSFDDDLKQLIPTASLTVREDWGVDQINSKLRANTYVTIERRYVSQSQDYDSGWVSFGHFLCEGPIGSNYQADGGLVYNVALKGVTKLLNLDLAHTPIEPDRLLVKKRKLDLTAATTEYIKYYMSRNPDDPSLDNVLINWAEFPSVKLWVTDFKNIDGDNEEGGISDPKEIIRIKGSEGAVRILGGEGAVVIDNTYRLDKVSENGLGDPSTILAEFYRYATSEDKEVTQVAAMSVVRNRWRIAFNSQPAFVDGMSLLVKSGNAKGKYWKLVGTQSEVSFDASYRIDASTTITNVGSETGSWTKVSSFGGSTPPPGGGTQYAAQAVGTGGGTSTYVDFKYLSVPVTVAAPTSSADWNDNSKVTGIRITFWRRGRNNYNNILPDNGVLDRGTHLKIGTLQTTDVQKTGRYSATTAWEQVAYGGDKQTLGATWTWGDIKNQLGDVAVRHKVRVRGSGGSAYVFMAEIYQVKVELFIEDLGIVTLYDIHGYPVHPEYEGLAVGDVVQIGDFNAVEDALRKALYRCHFQENDSSKPFYFELDDCPKSLAPSVPPIRPKLSEQTQWGELVEEIMKYAPPNYRFYTDAEGVTRARLVGFLIGEKPVHIIEGKLDINEDRGDYGIATRLVVEGEASDSFNIALNVDAGGTSACRAYVLSGYADPDRKPDADDSNGIDKTQSEADAIWKQVFNGNPKTPVPTTENEWRTRYGVILAKEGSPSTIKRWHFEDTPLCAIDIGRSSTGTPIEIEALQFTWINHYLEGNAISQSMIVHYMTEEAYEAEFGASLGATPVQGDTSYFPPADARSWQLLIDEFALQEGDTTIEANDFEGGEPKQVRFLKFTCGQGHFRFPVLVNNGDDDAAIRVTMSEIKVWTSKRIIATAELGVSGLFGSGEYKELATRLRRRTDYLEKNLYLNNYERAKTFALAELQERYVDFTPVTSTAFAPTVEVGDVVYLVHPKTRVGKAYLVIAVSHDATGIAKMQILNYDIPE